jgi:hypothetical protein
MTEERDRAWADYSERFRREVLPMLLSSAVSVSIHAGDGSDFDVQQATELGAMLLLGKPLILLSMPGARVPSGLARAADYVVYDWDPEDPGAQDRLAEAVHRMKGKLR